MIVPLLQSPEVTLRPYHQEHIAQTVDWLKQPQIQQNFGVIENISLDAHQKWLDNNAAVLKWAIYAQHYVGNLFFFPTFKHSSAYLQIYLGEQQSQGQGIGYQALTLALNHLFNGLNMHRVWLHCLPDNTIAIKLYQKLGFVYEGLERESIYRNNEFISQGRWSLLKSEWLKRDSV